MAGLVPRGLPRLYLIAIGDDFERRQAVDAVLSRSLPPDAIPIRMQGAQASLAAVFDALNSPTLLGPEPAVVVEEVDKKLIESLSVRLKEPLSFGCLILTSKQKIHAPWIEQHGAVLDLTEEKPWDKEKRWRETLLEQVHKAGKKIAPEAVAWMMEHLDRNAALASHEMDKLLCYAADRMSIELQDVQKICSESRMAAAWTVAEDLVWEKTFQPHAADLHDPSFFHVFLSAVRQQMQIGAKMHALAEGKIPFSKWGDYFPKVWPKALEKKAQGCQRLSSSYFRKGIEILFEIEMMSKSGSISSELLLDVLRLRLMHVSK